MTNATPVTNTEGEDGVPGGETIDVEKDGTNGKIRKTRVNWSKDMDQALVREVINCGAHIPEYGQLEKKFKEVCEALVENRQAEGQELTFHGCRERFKILVRKLRSKEQWNRSSCRMHEALSPLEMKLLSIIQEIDSKEEMEQETKLRTAKRDNRAKKKSGHESSRGRWIDRQYKSPDSKGSASSADGSASTSNHTSKGEMSDRLAYSLNKRLEYDKKMDLRREKRREREAVELREYWNKKRQDRRERWEMELQLEREREMKREENRERKLALYREQHREFIDLSKKLIEAVLETQNELIRCLGAKNES